MATDIGKAYIQIMPSAKGIKGALEQELNGSAGSAGTSAGNTIASKIKGVIVAAGIGTAIGAAINEGGKLQQSLGGVETLFKGSADKVKQYASQAFQSAGVSANEYMENVTSFSASLINSLGGDTAAAAELANTAMIDMSDNANKMGTDMELIQQTYQSLARGNYEMLDNLKLGYGGTKSEMERLMKDAEKLTGEHYTVGDFADTVKAIHAVQESMGITGTTAKEAATTLQGSFNSMKAAALDFIGNLALGMDITGPLTNLATTASTFFFGNLLPMLGNIISALPEAVITAIQTAGPLLMSNLQTLATNIVTFFQQNGPTFLQNGFEMVKNIADGIFQNIPTALSSITSLVNQGVSLFCSYFTEWLQRGINLVTYIANGIFQNIPGLLSSLSTMINQAITTFMTYLPTWLQKGIELVGKIAQGIINNLPQIASSIINLVTSALATFASNLPQFLQKGIELVGKVAAGLIQGVPQLLGQIPGILSQAASSFLSYDWVGIGLNIVQGIVNGIINAAGSIGTALMNAAKDAFNGVLSFLGIASPSRLFRDKVGKMIPAGIAVGIDQEAGLMKDSLKKASEDALNSVKITPTGTDAFRMSHMGGFISGPYAPASNQRVTNQTVNQTINSAKVLSPREIALQTKNAMRCMKWAES